MPKLSIAPVFIESDFSLAIFPSQPRKKRDRRSRFLDKERKLILLFDKYLCKQPIDWTQDFDEYPFEHSSLFKCRRARKRSTIAIKNLMFVKWRVRLNGFL